MASRTLRVRIVGDDSSLSRALGRSSSKVGKFGKLAGAALVSAGGAAVAFGAKAVMAASDLEETLSKTDQVFGKSSQMVRKFADDMAAAFGLPKAEMLDAASNIGLVGKASGLSEKAAAKMSTEMATLAADASSFFNVPLPDALEKIRAGLVGEAEPLRAFGVLLSAAAVEEEAVRMGIAKAGEELTEQQKVMARASIITRDMSDASGDLERTQDGLANRMREMRGRAENFAAAVGQKLIPIVLDAFDFFENTAIPLLQEFGEWIGPKIQPIIQQFGDTFGHVFGNLINAFKALTGSAGIGGFAAYIDNIFGGTGVVAKAITFVADLWERIFGKSGTVAKATNENRAFIDKTWRQISDLIRAAVETIRVVIDTSVKILRALWDRWGKDLIDFARRNWQSIKQVIGGALDIITGIFKAVTALLKGDWKGFGDALKQIAKGAWDVVRGIISGAFAAIETLFELGLAAMDALWDTTWNAIRTATKAAWRNIKEAIKGGLRAAWQMVKDWGKTLIEWFTNLPGKLVEALSGMGGKLKDAFEGALSKIKLSLPFSFDAVGDGPGRGGGGPALARSRALAAGLPISISSTYRSPAHNARVGGSPTSYHLDRGNPAVDWVGPAWALDTFAARLRSAGGWRELLWRTAGHYDHLHVAHKGGRVDESWPTLPGLAADERPAILQTGETVIPRGGAGVNVQVFIDGQEIRRALKIDRQTARAA